MLRPSHHGDNEASRASRDDVRLIVTVTHWRIYSSAHRNNEDNVENMRFSW